MAGITQARARTHTRTHTHLLQDLVDLGFIVGLFRCYVLVESDQRLLANLDIVLFGLAIKERKNPVNT
jgi:hypothetical protein